VTDQAILIALSGRPGVGKTTIAREVVRRTGAVHLRIDTIEQAMRDAGFAVTRDEGYRVGYALAEDNLRLGRSIVADSVNNVAVTRRAWREAARRAQAAFLNVEVICSDVAEHRRRVETRVSDIANLELPDWDAVCARVAEAWPEERLVVDTAKQSAADIAEMLDWPIERARRAFGI
jgi:predicted kinase